MVQLVACQLRSSCLKVGEGFYPWAHLQHAGHGQALRLPVVQPPRNSGGGAEGSCQLGCEIRFCTKGEAGEEGLCASRL